MVVDVDLLRWLHSEGFITLRSDPKSFLSIAKYTPKALQGRAFWDYPLLQECRGLVLDPSSGDVWAKPFRKFFNVNETPETSIGYLASLGVPEITHKLDGSAIVLFTDPESGDARCASLGSFQSVQARAAQVLWNRLEASYLQRHQRGIPYNSRITTWVFEYTSPINRIVVRYDTPSLTLIGSITTATGHERSYAEVRAEGEAFELPVAPHIEVYV